MTLLVTWLVFSPAVVLYWLRCAGVNHSFLPQKGHVLYCGCSGSAMSARHFLFKHW